MLVSHAASASPSSAAVCAPRLPGVTSRIRSARSRPSGSSTRTSCPGRAPRRALPTGDPDDTSWRAERFAASSDQHVFGGSAPVAGDAHGAAKRDATVELAIDDRRRPEQLLEPRDPCCVDRDLLVHREDVFVVPGAAGCASVAQPVGELALIRAAELVQLDHERVELRPREARARARRHSVVGTGASGWA